MGITPQYIPVPPYATLLPSEGSGIGEGKLPPAILVSGGSRLDLPGGGSKLVGTEASSSTQTPKPSFSNSFSFPNIFMPSPIQSHPGNPNPAPPGASSGAAASNNALLIMRDPLALQLTTANFRRFSSRAGPILWVVERVEEVLLWRKGWKYTATFISAYAAIWLPTTTYSCLAECNRLVCNAFLVPHPSYHLAIYGDTYIYSGSLSVLKFPFTSS
ncbi:hypothetical protein BS47DRAFT_1352363 [Hydnum rufescens UP504]|uniref:Uncharacterized protein n=1 Tax=Hydnum rufescens UP504 TaxID=1448309 RepID=A0A9P6AJA9_9AGAM|nr:hypothetical protein BS47DRAFT_1352363 [Hydnum rufescens UP504]